MELAQWRARTGEFAEGQRKYAWDALKAKSPVDGISFLTGFYDDSPLSLVYKVLQFVQITAAPCERNWLILTAIHTKLRNRLDVETASKLTFIKHNLLLKHTDLFKKHNRVNEADDPESEEEPNIEENSVIEKIDEFDRLFDD